MVDQVLSTTVWPTGVVVACLAAEALVLAWGIDDLDEGYFVQQASRVLHGQMPYRDFETLYTPGLAYLHAWAFAALGGPSLVGARAIALVARAGLALALVALARPVVRNPWWLAAPSLILLLGLDDAPVRWEPHPGWLSTLFAVVAVWCLGHRSTPRWLLASGAMAALSYSFKQNTGAFIIAAIVLWSGRRFWVPSAAFAAVTLLWLAPLAIEVGEPRRLGVLVGAVNQAGLVSAQEVTLLIPLAALAGGLWLLRGDSDPRLRWYLLAGTALFLTEFPRMDTLHLAWSAPLLLVLGAIALDRARPWLAVIAIAAVVILLAPTWTSRVTSLTLPRASVDGVEASIQTASEMQAALEDIEQRTQPGEPIFVYPTSPLLYVLADRANPTRFDHLNPGAATADQLNLVIADVQRAHVRLVVISDFWQTAWGPPGANAALEGWLASHYTEVARHGSYRLLAVDL